ncbi:30063_t:CDS:2 [Gigaspora margarita]|uniref:30063_t:CDS:1 n=1 Tax=Gigaspora margarita TaxID=4874 RepID=A0ABN7W4T4_GIGMA|nr:30063_t:CDS:2 [Gigaspora margarita]
MLCGEEYSIRGQFDYVLLYFNKVLEFSPNNKTALILSAKIFFILKKYENAIKYLNEILKDEPDNDIALFYRSEANFKLGRHKESHLNTEKLSKILEIEFNNSFILYNTDINFKHRQFNKAISDLDIAIKLKLYDIEMLIFRS